MRRVLPSTQALACFESAARHISYTKAAQELSLTQSAVSRQIIALEEFLGLALFRRTRHGVLLTDAGRHYATQVGRWLQGLERDTLDLMSHQGEGGPINLAAVPTFATRWLLPRLPLLQQSTRPQGWRQWFDAMHVDAPRALDGMRLELFSMLAVAASQGLGVALIPPMLIEQEIARGDLIVACPQPLRGNRAYYLVTPELAAEAQASPALRVFSQWLQHKAQEAAGRKPERQP